MRDHQKYFVIVALLVTSRINCEILGVNVCKEEKRIKVNVTEYFIQNITVRDYKWCVNVPPRCSYYTIRPVIIPRTVEKERLEVEEICCPGFTRQQNRCVAICTSCTHGKCDINGLCICSGENCSAAVDINRCKQGVYDEISKSCKCYAGWKGNRCDSLCDEGYYGEGCLQKCECPFCNSVNGECYTTVETTTESLERYKLGPPKLQKYYTFDLTTNAPSSTLETTSETKETTKQTESDDDQFFVTQKISPEELQNRNAPIVADDHIILGIVSAAAGGLIVLVLVATFAILRYRRKSKLEKTGEKRSSPIGVKTMSERATLNAFDGEGDPSCRIPIPHGTSETVNPEEHCTCDMKGNFYFYDYPPSTGSYRAASLPEPSEMELHSLRLGSRLTMEHVYDEIPAQKLHKCIDSSSHQTHFSVYFSKSTNALYSNENIKS